MINRYKISDLAKDFNMPSKEMIALVLSLTGEERNHLLCLLKTRLPWCLMRLQSNTQ